MDYHRWNFDANDTHILACKKNHEKAEVCEFEELHPAEVLRIINELRCEVKKQQVMTLEEFNETESINLKELRNQFAMNAPITFLDAAIQCGYNRADLTYVERATVMSVLAAMRYEYADAMIKQKEEVK